MPRLVYDDPGEGLQFLELTVEEVTIGRGPENTICLPGHWIHRRHALLRREPDGAYRLFDLDTRNGIWMGREKIPRDGVALQHGMEFRVTDIRCRYRDWDRAPTDWQRTVTRTVRGEQVELTFREYRHISGSSDFADDWEADVVPLLATFQHCHVTADLRECPLSFGALLGKLRVAGELLVKNHCFWNVRLSAELLTVLCDCLRMPPQQAVEFLAKVCHTHIVADKDHGADAAGS